MDLNEDEQKVWDILHAPVPVRSDIDDLLEMVRAFCADEAAVKKFSDGFKLRMNKLK